MKECEEHRYGKWTLIPFGNNGYGKETRSCTECGTSQVRSVELVDPVRPLPDKQIQGMRFA